jgi:hypothetical protein
VIESRREEKTQHRYGKKEVYTKVPLENTMGRDSSHSVHLFSV